MVDSDIFKRHNHILNRLRRSAASFKEIQKYLDQMSSLDGYNHSLSERTFKRDREKIAERYNIEIEYNQTLRAYEITSSPDRKDENLRRLEAFDIFNALNIKEKVSNFIDLENRKAEGTENLFGLMHACENCFEVDFTYLKYGDNQESKRRNVRPYGLKEFRHLWYLLAEDNGTVKTFGLDRLSNLDISRNKFEVPASFDVERMFHYSFGIMLPDRIGQYDVITLAFDPMQSKYIKSLPLHQSQEIIKEDEDGIVVRVKLYPSYDFIMELMSYGHRVEVLSPKSVRDEVAYYLEKALELYEK